MSLSLVGLDVGRPSLVEALVGNLANRGTTGFPESGWCSWPEAGRVHRQRLRHRPETRVAHPDPVAVEGFLIRPNGSGVISITGVRSVARRVREWLIRRVGKG